MRFGSVCSGIEAASVAWEPLGWKASWLSEIDPFPCSLLAHRYPETPNFGDMTKFKEWPNDPINVFVGGTPCQSFSVAGLRKGMDDPRGNLALTYLAIADKYRPRWLVWENVPGVLSSNGGRDFGSFLGALGQLGYGFAYRVLDAQYFGVAQRRRRVFVVGYLGDWRRAAAVLFEREGLSGYPAPRREKGQDVAGTFKACASSGGWSNSADHAAAGYMIPVVASGKPTIGTLMANAGTKLWLGNQEALSGDYHILDPIAFGAQNSASQGDGVSTEVVATLDKSKTPAVSLGPTVRRLTPRECERLQGFPDDYTLVPHRNKPAADGPRYKALGNSMAVPVMRWIGERIQHIEGMTP